MEVLLIAFLIGIFVVALLVTTAVMSRARNNSTDLLSDFDRMYYQDHGLRHS
ncbi:MAG: hypothetical protein K2M39_02805 [Muribaculaceae bacterium]|nr:hypothetical protein [Muribaculaceae bacterium]